MPRCMSLMTSGSSLPVGVDGLRLCLVKYDDEPEDLGRDGRESVGGNTKSVWPWWCV